MNNRDLGSFVIKMLGVYAFIQSLPLIQSVFFLLFTIADQYGGEFSLRRILLNIASIVIFLLSLLLGFILIAYSDRIARIIIRQKNDLPKFDSISSKQFQAICFSAVGVFLFIQALPGLLQILNWFVFLREQSGQHLIDRILQLSITTGIKLILATILFFRSTGLANLWHRIQIAKYYKIEETPDNQPDSKDN